MNDKNLLADMKGEIWLDLEFIVNGISTPSHLPGALSAFYAKWTSREPGFVDKFRDRYGKLDFTRASLPAGYPIVDILESFNKRVKADFTCGELLSPPVLLDGLAWYLATLSIFANRKPPQHALEIIPGLTPGHIRPRITKAWQSAIKYVAHEHEGRIRHKQPATPGYICISSKVVTVTF